MQKKKNTRLVNKGLVSDILVTVLCLAGLYFSVHFFNEAINQSLDKINETPIGTITFKQKTAQRKLLDRVLWDRLKQDSPVYNGDIIRTSELSEATVSFIDGNVMNLYEQTLAQVFLDLDGAAVDFTEGGISLDTTAASTGMTLTSGNATVQLETGSALSATVATATTAQDGTEVQGIPLSLQMTSGSANLVAGADGSSGEVVTLTEGNVLALSDGGQTFAPPSITMISPSANAKILKQTGETIPVDFNWVTENIAQNEYITLETSKTRDFTELTEQISFTRVNAVSLDIPQGTWYWRIYAESNKEQSVNGRLQVLDAPIPTSIVPANNDEYRFRTKVPSIRFMWSDDNYATSWQLEVANNAQMNNPVINQRSSQPSSIISSLEEGTWYWRVTSLYATGIITQNPNEQASSAVNLFEILRQGQLEAVNLILPVENGFVNTTKADSGFHFSWKHDYETAYYDVVISSDANLSSPIVAQKVTDNYFVLMSEVATLENGRWYWSVTQTDSEGNTSPQGDIRSFLAVEGEVEQRTIFPPDDYVLAENLVSDTRFTWRTNLPFAMRFQLASDDEFRNITIDRTLDSPSISGLSLPVGTWYWRIVADTEENGVKTLEYYTLPKTVISAPYLGAVSMTAPLANNILVVRPYAPVEYAWKAVEGAQYYQLKLFHNSDLTTPVYENLTIEATSVFIDMKNMEEGDYLWTMRAMASETAFSTRRSGILSEQTFTMRKLIPIELLSPANRIEIDGLEAVFNPLKAEWSAVETPVNAEFIVTQQNRGLSAISRDLEEYPLPDDIYFTVENPDTTIQFPSLSAGTWYWTVVAETEDGLNITASQPSRIIVKPIPLLPIANNANPQTKTVFDIDYLRQQLYVDFSWDVVEGADGYIFQILNERNEILIEERIDEGNGYYLESLAVLDKGKFSWTVEAVLRLPDDSIIQRGNVTPLTFTIDLPQISSPNTQATGELYGL